MAKRDLRTLVTCCLLALASSGCVSLDYDLSPVPLPIDAKPSTDAGAEDFRIEAKNVLWLHGLFGHEEPDVAALLSERAEGYDHVAGFRVRQTSNVHQWLLTHLSLTLVRMRTVVIEGQLVRSPAPANP